MLLEEVYHIGLDDPKLKRPSQLDTIRKYRQICCQLAVGPWKEAELTIKSSFNPLIQRILHTFKDPWIIIKKRDAKRLDFERVNGLKAKGDQVLNDLC